MCNPTPGNTQHVGWRCFLAQMWIIKWFHLTYCGQTEISETALRGSFNVRKKLRDELGSEEAGGNDQRRSLLPGGLSSTSPVASCVYTAPFWHISCRSSNLDTALTTCQQGCLWMFSDVVHMVSLRRRRLNLHAGLTRTLRYICICTPLAARNLRLTTGSSVYSLGNSRKREKVCVSPWNYL